MIPHRVVLAVLVVPLLGGCVGGAFTAYEENDAFSLKGTRDAYYTQGLRLSRVFAPEDTPHLARDIAREFPLYEEEETTSIGVVLGQTIYTPRDITVKRDQPDDRPWAGWLYGGVVFSKQKMDGPDWTGDSQDTVEIDLGVVGDASLARSVQTRWHDALDLVTPRGWDHQLHFEPGIVATYERRDRALFAELPLGTQFDFLPGYGASLGNVMTNVSAGVRARFGINLPRDFGVNTISTTAMEVSDKRTGDRISAHLFGGAEGRGVIRNIFLDGNTFRDSASVDKRFGVAEFRGGISVQWKAMRLTYSWITRSPEFDGQGGWTRYGSVSLGLFLDF